MTNVLFWAATRVLGNVLWCLKDKHFTKWSWWTQLQKAMMWNPIVTIVSFWCSSASSWEEKCNNVSLLGSSSKLTRREGYEDFSWIEANWLHLTYGDLHRTMLYYFIFHLVRRFFVDWKRNISFTMFLPHVDVEKQIGFISPEIQLRTII